MVPCPRQSANASVWSLGMCAVVTTQPASRIAAASSASGEPVKLGPTCAAAGVRVLSRASGAAAAGSALGGGAGADQQCRLVGVVDRALRHRVDGRGLGGMCCVVCRAGRRLRAVECGAVA